MCGLKMEGSVVAALTERTATDQAIPRSVDEAGTAVAMLKFSMYLNRDAESGSCDYRRRAACPGFQLAALTLLFRRVCEPAHIHKAARRFLLRTPRHRIRMQGNGYITHGP
jgi:hypothetical protein